MNQSFEEARALIVSRLSEERQRQIKKFGSQMNVPDPIWLAILMEEVGELAQTIFEQYHHHGEEIAHNWRANMEMELEQVTAVGLAWLEVLQCRRWSAPAGVDDA